MAYTQYPSRDRQMTNTFYGLGKGKRIRDGAWNDMLNMTCDDYPVAATRKKRIPISFTTENGEEAQPMTPGVPVKFTEHDEDIYAFCADGKIVLGDKVFDTGYNISGVVEFGRDFVTLPAVDHVKGDLSSEQSAHITVTGISSFSMTADGDILTYTSSDTAPAQKANGDFWYDTKNNELYKYSEAYGEWIAFPETYIRITLTEEKPFRKGDAIRISGTGNPGLDQSFIIADVGVTAVNGDSVTWISVRGWAKTKTGQTLSAAVTERRAPIFDFIVQHRNRIWGCRYGENADGEFVNEIYGSALGDPLNYFVYEGTAADSFTASVGTGGRWSGIGTVDDCVVFFKEDRLYILSGTEPPFRLREVQAHGVQIGSEKSVVSLNGYLYYKSNHGVMRMTADSLPTCISYDIGDDIYGEAMADTDGRKLFIQMAQSADAASKHMFVFDTKTGLWTEESPIEDLVNMMRYKNNLLAVSAEENEIINKISIKLHAPNEPQRADFPDGPLGESLYRAMHKVWEVFDRVYIAIGKDIPYAEVHETVSEFLGHDATKEEVKEYCESNGMAYTEEYCRDVLLAYISAENYIDVPLPINLYAFNDDESKSERLVPHAEDEPDFVWLAETGLLGLGDPDEKIARMIQVRAKTAFGARLRCEISYNDSNEWTPIYNEIREATTTHVISHKPGVRCDTFRLRFSGTGACDIYSITITTEGAGDNVHY